MSNLAEAIAITLGGVAVTGALLVVIPSFREVKERGGWVHSPAGGNEDPMKESVDVP